nr:MAG TPA: hypothetical protein [Caudoviricetes sp.]
MQITSAKIHKCDYHILYNLHNVMVIKAIFCFVYIAIVIIVYILLSNFFYLL